MGNTFSRNGGPNSYGDDATQPITSDEARSYGSNANFTSQAGAEDDKDEFSVNISKSLDS